MGQRRMDGRLDIHTFIFRPGKVFAIFLSGPGRQTALLSAKALQYDLNNERWEKRLTRYLSWQWRCRAHSVTYKQPYRIEILLEAVGEKLNTSRPHRTRERLEKAMERLLTDGVLKGWQYEQWDENIASQYGWAKKWLQATVSVEPPDNIRNQYQNLGRYETPAQTLRAPKAAPAARNMLGDQIEQHRRKRGLAQAAAAHQLGITQSYLSKLESGTAKPNHDLLERIQLWLQRN